MIIYPMKNRIGKDHIKFLLKRQIQRIAYLEFYFRKLIFRLVYHAARTVNAYNSCFPAQTTGLSRRLFHIQDPVWPVSDHVG